MFKTRRNGSSKVKPTAGKKELRMFAIKGLFDSLPMSYSIGRRIKLLAPSDISPSQPFCLDLGANRLRV